jgi:hypothetical protein
MLSSSGSAGPRDPLALAAAGLGDLPAALGTGLAFTPPRAYLAWVRARR